jgi:trk system potassium uptake protein TrkA
MIACEVAKNLFNVPMKIARVRHQNYLHSAWSEMLALKQSTIELGYSLIDMGLVPDKRTPKN